MIGSRYQGIKFHLCAQRSGDTLIAGTGYNNHHTREANISWHNAWHLRHDGFRSLRKRRRDERLMFGSRSFEEHKRLATTCKEKISAVRVVGLQCCFFFILDFVEQH